MKIPATIFLTALSTAGPASASELSAAFNIVRKGDMIGYHAVEVTEEGGITRTETRIRMRVKFGPVVVFRYDLASIEHWRDGALQSIESSTDRNGRKMNLTVQRTANAFVVNGSSYQGEAPLNAIPGSYWNKEIVDAPVLLNTQNGSLVPVKGADLGQSKTPAGEDAEHYRLSGSVDLDLWYEGQKWVGAEFTIKGEDLAYQEMDDTAQETLFSEIGFAGS
ncbi:MAG: DUF6134 family protein [Parvularculaceae bacterium]